MTHRYAEIAFTEPVRRVQETLGSRRSFQRWDEGETRNHEIGERESAFIAARDSFYMATVGATGWPYIQHRGGPVGFVRVLDPSTIGFADFRGNRQYISVGNLAGDERAALFFMDYANRARLKLFGRVALIGAERQETLDQLDLPDHPARIERGFVVKVEGFDWNCPQHITPRFTAAEVVGQVARLQAENRVLREQIEGAAARPRSARPRP